MTRARRRALVALAIGAAIVIALAWAVPSAAGRFFVDVAARVAPAAGSPTTTDRSIVLPDGSASTATELRIEVQVTNHYPLPVVVEFRGSAIHASLVARDRPGAQPVWHNSTDDPTLESGDDSPDNATSRVAVLQPGVTVLPSDAARLILDVGSTAAVPAGIYALQVSAFGIAGSPVLVSIVDGAG
jgi:hypothetical protein